MCLFCPAEAAYLFPVDGNRCLDLKQCARKDVGPAAGGAAFSICADPGQDRPDMRHTVSPPCCAALLSKMGTERCSGMRR